MNHNKKKTLIYHTNGKSLEEINGSVNVPKNAGFLKNLFAYSGPGALVAVGYMDPGNWSTSITGGQNFQYLLISVILLSSLIAMLLQYMSAKLGLVSQMDLAQAIRSRTSQPLGIILWLLTELAIMATDIAEVIGAAIALYLLFNIPLILAVFITVFDVFLLLLLTRVGFRKIEALVVCLILVILIIFAYQVALSNPNWSAIFAGFVPNTKTFSSSPTVAGMTPLTGSLGIIGATVMPHNLYLHSSLSQSRRVNHENTQALSRAVRFSTWDSNIQLTVAFIVNSLLLIMGVAVFRTGVIKDPSFFGLYDALSNPTLLNNGGLANLAKTGALSVLFAVALLASGQNSTITGTLTGQIIMEGFIHLKIPIVARRLVTRLISVIPVLICVSLTKNDSLIAQHETINRLLNDSQVFLAFALPFSILPLLMLTNSEKVMGTFKNSWFIQGLGWLSVIFLICLNLIELPSQIKNFFPPKLSTFAEIFSYALILLILGLLLWTMLEFHREKRKKEK